MVFKRALIGFDGSPPSERALAVAQRLCAPDAQVEALIVAETHFAMHAGMDAVAWDGQIRAAAREARLLAERELADVPGAQTKLVTGHAASCLIAAAKAIDADLVAVGAHGHRRIPGLLVGSVAARVVRDAPCSVLIAHGDRPLDHFPQTITVGVNGSAASDEAATIAEALAVAAGGAEVQRIAATGSAPHSLIEASRASDLLVLGTRSLHGLHALGSVAERVAYAADCPVLVVRAAATSSSPQPLLDRG